jgi:cytochrome P450
MIPRPEPNWHGADPSNPAYLDDPYPIYERLRTEHPVSLTPEGVWRLTHYDDCLRMLRLTGAGMRRTDGRLPGQTAEEAAADATGQFMLLTDPPKHTRLRKLVSKAFTPRAIAAWRARIETVTEELLDRVAATGEMDLIADLALPVPATLICEMLGVPVEDRDTFTEWTTDATHGLALRRGNAPPELVARVETARMGLAGYFNQLIEARRGQQGDDLLSTLIAAEEEGDRLNTEELLIQSIGLLIAGFETTIGLIGNGLTTLIRHPQEIERLRSQPDLIESAVEECLRFSGPITWTVRILHEPAEFGGYRFESPKDSTWDAMPATRRRLRTSHLVAEHTSALEHTSLASNRRSQSGGSSRASPISNSWSRKRSGVGLFFVSRLAYPYAFGRFTDRASSSEWGLTRHTPHTPRSCIVSREEFLAAAFGELKAIESRKEGGPT